MKTTAKISGTTKVKKRALLNLTLAVAVFATNGAVKADDNATESKSENTESKLDPSDPWYENQGWPGQQSINREGGRTWWDTEESAWPQWERGILRFGAMVADFDTSLSFTVNDAIGLGINAEELLGLESQHSTWRIDGEWRFGKTKRNTFDFTYAAFNRSAGGTTSVDIPIGGGEVIPVGATVNTVFNFDIIRGTYTFAFFQDKRIRMAAGLGAYVLPVDYGLTVTPLNGNTVGYDTTDAILPLPTLAFRGQYRITPKFYAYTNIDFMYAEIGDFSGKLIDLRLGVEYQIWRYFGLGVGYNAVEIDVSSSKSSDYVGQFVGDIDVQFGGLMLYGKLSF